MEDNCGRQRADGRVGRARRPRRRSTLESPGDILECIADGFVTLDRDWRYTYVNRAWELLARRGRDELLGRSVWEAHPDLLGTRVETECRRAVSEGVTIYLEEYYPPSRIWLGASVCPSSDGLVVYARDVTERKRLEETLREQELLMRALQRSEAQLRDAQRIAQLGSWEWDPASNMVAWSPEMYRITGVDGKEFDATYQAAVQLIHPADRAAVTLLLDRAHREHEPFACEHRIVRPDGAVRILQTRGGVVEERDHAIRVVGTAQDITERRNAEQRMAYDAAHDRLTGLPNQAAFIDQLKRAVTRAKRHADYLFAVLFLDLDRFKVINDSLGHVIADQLLVQMARKLEAGLRPEDMVARFGGDEFVIFLDGIVDSRDATRVARRIHADLVNPFTLGGNEVFTSASIGIALSAHGYERAEDCLRDADIAMYRAKALGKARHEVFDKSMHAHAVALLHLETDLRRAVQRQEFRVHYQPIVSLETGRIAGLEALLRWQHPSRGLILPSQFMPVAEETGLILAIGQSVLSQACQQMRAWQEQVRADPSLALSVNLSSREFSQADLIDRVPLMLAESGLDARSLKLDITEGVVMKNSTAAMTTIRRFGELGIKFHLDDFGTGYSSLSYLHRFSAGALKIDRSFIRRMGGDAGSSEIVRTIAILAHNLHMDVIAEGVETREQLTQLKALRCKYGQGYYFSRPVDAPSAAALLARGVLPV